MTIFPKPGIIYGMSKEIVKISPEGLDVANAYLQFGNINAVAQELAVPAHKVTELLAQKDVKRYIDNVYLDLGYRNRNNIASVMDEMIASKLEEAQVTGIYTSKDLADLMQMAHKMRMEEIKALASLEKTTEINNQTNVQFNGAEGNYGKLMERLLKNA